MHKVFDRLVFQGSKKQKIFKIILVGMFAVSLTVLVLLSRTVWSYFFEVPVVIEPAVLSVGDVAAGGVGKGVVYLKNMSNRTLHLERPIAGCGCTRVQAPRMLRPNESVPITVDYEAASTPRLIRKAISLKVTEYPTHPFVLPVHGRIYTAFRIEPESIDLGVLEAYQSKKFSFFISRYDGEDHSLSRIQSSNLVSVTIKKSGAGTELQGRLTASFIPGNRSEYIYISTSEKTLPFIIARVTYHVQPRFKISPAEVNFGVVSTPAKKLLIKVTGEAKVVRPLNIPSGVTVRVVQANKNSWLIKVRTTRQGQGGILDRRLVFATDDPKQPQIVIPVYAAFKQ